MSRKLPKPVPIHERWAIDDYEDSKEDLVVIRDGKRIVLDRSRLPSRADEEEA
ncbi:MAG: hypothetical protein OXI83_10335 [Gemmatimonadota bacterium]|nr:hypothetical protein [Gemmatimonadota bacterium]